MRLLKKFIIKYFENFSYFYRHLRYRLFLTVGISLLVGLLDGLGLSMFLPLLQVADQESAIDPSSLGQLSFVLDIIGSIGLGINLLSVLIFMCIFFILKGVAVYVRGWYSTVVRQYFIKKMRIESINALNNISYKKFVLSDVGQIQNTLTGEVDRVSRAYINYFTAMQQGVMVIVYMAYAFMIDIRFAVMVSIGGLLTNIAFKIIYKNTKGASRKLTTDSHAFQGLIIQHVAGFKYLKATGHLQNYGRKLIKSILEIEISNRKIGLLTSLLTATREPLVILVVAAVIYIQTSVLDAPLAPIFLSLIFFYRALTSLMQMQTFWNNFLTVSGSMENMTSFMNMLSKSREKKGNMDIDKFNESIKLDKINFSYGEEKILKDITLTIKKNESIAFVGESGSGKTTLINLISGLLPVEGGMMLIDGKDSCKLNLNSFQERIGYITQDPVIFNDTIFNNVTFWAEKNTENIQKFTDVAKKAAIFEYITGLPDGEDTELGNNGINLSGGQKQRISIARELYKNIDILILDEATSALDTDTEKTIQQNIDSLKGAYTILIVAHRLSTVKNADRIVVMNKGEIISMGPFTDLVEKNPYFKRMVEMQELV